MKPDLVPIEETAEVTCENCDHKFKGKFCPNCGQEVEEFNRPVGFILYDFLNNFYAFDTKFFKTFKYLLLRPGFLTIEFFKGHRVRYAPPFRIFIFLSFILFFLLQILSDNILNYSVPSNVNNETDTIAATTDSVFDNDSLTEGIHIKWDTSKNNDIRSVLISEAERVEKKIKKASDPETINKLQAYIVMCRAPETVISKIFNYLSWAFFILLPLFALILELFYLRCKQRYIKHFIFSIHLHSFIFLILILVVSLLLIFNSGTGWIITILMLCIPVYQVFALKRFYGQTYSKAFFKMIGTNILYQALLWTAIIISIVKSFTAG